MFLGRSVLICFMAIISGVIFTPNSYAQSRYDRELINPVHVNQLGYRPMEAKVALLAVPGKIFRLMDENSGKPVFLGNCSPKKNDALSQEMLCVIDFSAWQGLGNYYLEVDGRYRSAAFTISQKPYAELSKAALKTMYYQRCGIELDAGLVGDFAHGPCHLGPAEIYGTDQSHSADGGWHDAGDYGKYTVAAAITTAHLLLAWELYPAQFDDALGIPESGNGIADILDESRVGLEWLLKMQAPEGGFYHKLTTPGFPGLDVAPDYDFGTLTVLPISSTATADASAVLAKASRIWRSIDSAFADRCLGAALAGWAWLERVPFKAYTNPNGIRTGEYGDSNGRDEMLWAASELLNCTGRPVFHEYIRKIMQAGDTVPRSLGWQDTTSFFTVSYLQIPQNRSDTYIRNQIQGGFEKRLAELEAVWQGNAYQNMMSAGDYHWGSNMSAMDQAATILLYKRLFGLSKGPPISRAMDNLHYILGRNSLDKSYVTGFGANSVQYPHHRPSIMAGFGAVVPGMLVGGPNANLEDSIAQSALAGKPGPFAYIDDAISPSTNENDTYWNSIFIVVLAGIEAR